MKHILFLLLMCTILSDAWAQKYTVSGNVMDSESGEDLIGATILVLELPGTGSLSNQYGFFSITLPEGEYTLRFQYIGYEAVEQTIKLNQNQKLNTELKLVGQNMEAVEITARKEDENISQTEMGVTRLNPREMESIPVLFGEKDILKVFQLSPGVKSAGEGNSGFYVRGGGLDQNLILLDEAPVYNASHLLGFFSVFNSDAIKDVTLYKGGMSAAYGGRASSVMDIRMKEGNNRKFGVSGGIGLIASRLAVEGPIVKEKGSFIVTGRRTYADAFLRLSSDEAVSNSQLYFYDLNAKANYKFSDKDRIFLSGYFGRDNFGFGEEFGFDWGNTTATLRWNHLYSDKLFSNTSLIFSRYSYEFSFGTGDEAFGLESVIQDWNLKQDFTYFHNNSLSFKFGANLIHHRMEPGNLNAGANSSFTPQQAEPRYSLEGAVYLQADHELSSRVSINYGLRYSFFNYMGEGTAYTFDDKGNVLSEETYDNWESIQFYGGLEPRLSAKYQLDGSRSLKASYNRNYQYLHLLSNSTTATPTDLWVPSSNNIEPQIADQVSIGYFQNFAQNMFEFSVEAYYKDMQNLIDYRDGADLFINNTIESELLYGRGYAYGIEFFLRKRRGRLTGWLGYTLSRTMRQFDEINNGNAFPARQDRIHDIALVAMYELSPKITLSGNWVYYTGDAVTFPSGRYEVENFVVPYYTERNGYRIPDYHRLDLGLTWIRKKTEKFESSWNFSIYNAYGRENAFSINFQQNETDPTATEAVKLSLFRWVPSFTYNFKF